jgi:hypothetical protein
MDAMPHDICSGREVDSAIGDFLEVDSAIGDFLGCSIPTSYYSRSSSYIYI